MKIEIMVNRGEIKKLFMSKSTMSKLEIPFDKLDEDPILASKLITGSGRILVRKSGTESKIRIMGESENKRLLIKCVNIILKKIR